MITIDIVLDTFIGDAKTTVGNSAIDLVIYLIDKAVAEYQTSIEIMSDNELTDSSFYQSMIMDHHRLIMFLEPDTLELIPGSPLMVAAVDRVLLNSLDDLL